MDQELLQPLMGAGDGVLALDAQQRIVFWNEAIQEILGYKAENILGQTCVHLFRTCSLQGALPCRIGCRIFQQAFQGRQLPPYRIEVLARDGRHVLLDVSAVLLPGPDTFSEQTVLLLFCRQLAAELCPGGKMCLHLLGPLRVWRSDGSPVSGRSWQPTTPSTTPATPTATPATSGPKAIHTANVPGVTPLLPGK